ncbi:DMT family transporter [Modestobacter sp. URMC 112]
MVYALLTFAIAAEVAATSLLPRTAGFTALVPSLAVLAGYATSIVLLAHVVKTMPVGVTYAIWASVGTLAVVTIGATFLGQTLTGWQLVGVVMVVGGVVLLNLGGAAH